MVNYGHRHKGYGVTLHMLELMGKCFVVSIQGELEDAECWNSKMKKAWVNMFRFITFFMSVGYGDGFLKCQIGTVFENHRKSRIQYCERSELRLRFEWTNVH